MTSPYNNYGYAITTANALRSPTKTAISYRGEDVSYSQLTERVNRCANALLASGIMENQHVAVLIHDALPIAECYLALAKIGATLVALNPYWEDEVMQQVVEHSDIDAMIFQQQDAPRLLAIKATLTNDVNCLQWESNDTDPSCNTLQDKMVSASNDEPPLAGGGDQALAFFFTSGTTGLPKAVIHSHNSCRSMAEIWTALPRNKQSIWGTGPIIWGIGFPCTIGAALYVGMPVALEDDFGPAGMLDAMSKQPISHMTVIPSFWSDLLANHQHQHIDLSSIQLVILGGEPLANTLLNKIKQRIPNAAIYAFYGQTEAPYTCFGRLDDGSQAANVAGPAREGCAARVVDANQEAVYNSAGELAVTGPHCMQAYYKRPEKTAEALQNGWFYSGDLAIQDNEGRITVLGRRDDAIVRNGSFYQPLEIEDVALAIDGISEAAALGFNTDDSNNQSILLAVSGTKSLQEHQIEDAIRQHLPAHLLPDRIVICEQLPHNNDNSGGKGKLAKRQIHAQFSHLFA